MTDPLANEEMALIVEYFLHSRMYLVCLELIVVDQESMDLWAMAPWVKVT